MIDVRRWRPRVVILRLRIRALGARPSVGRGVEVQGGGNVVIGDRVNIMRQGSLFANDGLLTIGDDCSFNTNVHIGASQGSIVIGNKVLIGPNSVLRAADHGMSGNEPVRFQPHEPGRIVIEDEVWIGANCVVTKNVTIGRGSVIGAGSIVTKSVPEFSIVMGQAAEVRRTR